MAKTSTEVFDSECDTNGCSLDMDIEMMKLTLFADMIEKDEWLNIWDDEKADDGDSFIIRNNKIQEGEIGAFVRVPVREVIEKPVEQIISVVKNERKERILDGITRIVGYYSRMSNWNLSKVGELRDRAGGIYKFSNTPYNTDYNRDRAVNNLHA